MKYFVKDISLGPELCAAIPELFSKTKGIEIGAEKHEGAGYAVESDERGFLVKYSDLSHLATAIGDIVSGDIVSEDKCHKFSHPLKFRALMLDCSRNAVYKVSFLKDAIVRLALMGMNYLCLYTEDTYQVEGEPLIGYSRGAYSKDEIRELVDFAEKLGITIFPCIQTLGHLEQILKYARYANLRDNDRVLNALLPETYDFISKLISEASSPYKTDLIHLGMDEAWGIGRGDAFKPDTPINPRKLYAEHVAKVAKICEEKKLKPIIWGDFVLGAHGEAPMNNEEISIVPQNVILNYWNYGTKDEKKYQFDFGKIKNSGFDCIASPGLWNWGNFLPDLNRVRENCSAMMKTVHQEKIEKVMMTMWGDDGNECLFNSCWLSLSYFFALCRKPEDNQSFYRARAEKICGVDFAKFARFEKIGRLAYNSPDGKFRPNPKMYFYEEPLYPAAVLLLDKGDISLLKGLSKFYSSTGRGSGKYRELFAFVSLFCEISASKLLLARKLIKNYPGQRKKLKKNAADANKLAKKVRKLHSLYRKLWLDERKPFGLEEMDYRFAGLAARLDICADTIRAFLKGKIYGISELEQDIPLDLLEVRDADTARKLRTKSLSSVW